MAKSTLYVLVLVMIAGGLLAAGHPIVQGPRMTGGHAATLDGTCTGHGGGSCDGSCGGACDGTCTCNGECTGSCSGCSGNGSGTGCGGNGQGSGGGCGGNGGGCGGHLTSMDFFVHLILNALRLG